MKKYFLNIVASILILSIQPTSSAQEYGETAGTGRFDLYNKEDAYVVIDDQTMYYSDNLVIVSADGKNYRKLDDIPDGTPVRYNYRFDKQSFFISRLEILTSLPLTAPFGREKR